MQENIAAENNHRLEGQAIEVLIVEVDGSIAYGRTQHDAPEVDNECILKMGEVTAAPGNFCVARIEESTAYELHGSIEKIVGTPP